LSFSGGDFVRSIFIGFLLYNSPPFSFKKLVVISKSS